MAEQKINIDTSDYSVNTDNKSLIKINLTSYNVYDNWFDFIRKYFGIDDLDDPMISTLKASFFGYFNEIASSEIKNAVYHRNFLYDEHFLNTAILPESIYNFAKQYNVPIESAIPANLNINLSFIERQLINCALLKEEQNSKGVITNANSNALKVYSLTFDRDTIFSISNFNYMLPYPLIINIQEIEDGEGGITYSFSAHYDLEANNFPIATDGLNPYLKIWREVVDGTERLFIGCQVYQLMRKRNEITITTSTENPETFYHNIPFDNQLSYFEAFYEYNGEMIPLNLYFNNIYTPSEEEYYGYFTYLNDQTLQISFSSNLNAFRPVAGSTLYIDCYTTKGSEGNFEYSGNVSLSLYNNESFSTLNVLCTTNSVGSVNGKDKLDTIGQKTKILEAITTRNNIITENDLNKFFDSVNESLNVNGSKIKFLKKQDDVIKRIYCNFLLLRDENRRVLPTNTAPYVKVKADKIIIPDKFKPTQAVIKEHSIVECNYVRDIKEFINDLHSEQLEEYDKFFNNNERISQDYIEYTLNNNYFSDKIRELDKLNKNDITTDSDMIKQIMETLECDSDLLVYTIPYLISIQTEPFLHATYYNVDINKEFTMGYEYLNNKIPMSFNISKIEINKDISPSADNEYTLDSNVYKLSFNLNTNLTYEQLKEKVIIKCNVYDKECENFYGFFFFKLSETNLETSALSDFKYLYEAELSTDYKFNNTNELNLYNSLYNYIDDGKEGKIWLANDVFVKENLTFKLGILYEDEFLSNAQSITEKQDFNINIPESYFEGISYGNLDKTVSFTSTLLNDFNFSLYNDSFSSNGNTFNEGFKHDLSDLTNIKSLYTNVNLILALPVNANYLKPYSENISTNGLQSNDYTAIFSPVNFKSDMFKNYKKIAIKLSDEKINTNLKMTIEGQFKILIKDVELENSTYNFELVYDFVYNNDKLDPEIKNMKIEDNILYIEIEDIFSTDCLSALYLIHRSSLNDSVLSKVYYRETIENSDIAKNQIDTVYFSYLLKLIEENNIKCDITFAINNHQYVGTNPNLNNMDNQLNKYPEISEVISSLTDLDLYNLTGDKTDIDNYCLAAILKNTEDINLYKNMDSLISSIVEYDKENDEYKIELVPLIGLRYYIARPKTVYEILNKLIDFVDSNLPRLENNTNADIKLYNTYGPSRYFYFNKYSIVGNDYYKSGTNEQITNIEEIDNPYEISIVTKNNIRYNYLGRTDIILDFDIYLYENITNEKDAEIKKYISDFVEECNEELILPISNLIMNLQNNFNIIKYIKYNGVFSDVLSDNDTSKGNDYQLINNDFNFLEMTKEEVRTYVPEYLNLKKDVVKTNKTYSYEYNTYDYVIKITYRS